VPDLALLAELSPTPASVWFGAAPVPVLYHALFRWLARGVRFGLIRSLAPIAPLMTFVAAHAVELVVEAAVLGAPDLVSSPAFRDELVELVVRYLRR